MQKTQSFCGASNFAVFIWNVNKSDPNLFIDYMSAFVAKKMMGIHLADKLRTFSNSPVISDTLGLNSTRIK